MRTEILFSLIITVVLAILCFISIVILAMQMNEVIQFFNQCLEYLFNSNRNNGLNTRRRRRRNAIYIQRQQHVIETVKEIELPKKKFIIIENPNSPYTLGIEHSTE